MYDRAVAFPLFRKGGSVRPKRIFLAGAVPHGGLGNSGAHRTLAGMGWRSGPPKKLWSLLGHARDQRKLPEVLHTIHNITPTMLVGPPPPSPPLLAVAQKEGLESFAARPPYWPYLGPWMELKDDQTFHPISLRHALPSNI